MSADARVAAQEPARKEHTRVCPRCGTEFPIAELCPLCYGWEKPAGTPTPR